MCKRSIPPDPPVMAPVVPIAPRAAPGLPSLAPRRHDGGVPGWMAVLGVLGLVLAAAFVLYVFGAGDALTAFDEDAVAVAPPLPAGPLRAAPQPPAASRRAEPVTRASKSAAREAAVQPRPAPSLDPWQRTPEPQRAGAQPSAAQDADDAARDRQRSARIESDRERRALMHARGNILVVMYSTAWCPSCKVAREYMTSKGIAFVDNDVDESASARAILKRLNPRGSIPTIDIDGEVMIGFGQEHFEAMLDRAARKHAGI